MSAALLREWLASDLLNLPLPGSGETALRFARLAGLAEVDVVAGRLAEAHADAVAILAELGGHDAGEGQIWGVWAAEGPRSVLEARATGARVILDGEKQWCSGASICTHALVTARLAAGSSASSGAAERALFAVDLSQHGVTAMPSGWHNVGMAESDTRAVRFASAEATAIGTPGEYLSRPGFWHGAVGVAACWLGGARAVAAPLYARTTDDPHALAHLGAVDAALAAGDAMVMAAAAEFDADPENRKGAAELMARRARAVVETAVEEAIGRTGRALGPGPLCSDAGHAQRVADLTVYVRQSHAERDLEQLGRLAGAHR